MIVRCVFHLCFRFLTQRLYLTFLAFHFQSFTKLKIKIKVKLTLNWPRPTVRLLVYRIQGIIWYKGQLSRFCRRLNRFAVVIKEQAASSSTGKACYNREVKLTFTANGTRQTAKIKLLPSVFSSTYSRIKIFVFAVNSKRHLSIFV